MKRIPGQRQPSSFLFLLAVLWMFSGVPAEAQKRPMTVDDHLNLVRLRGIRIAPDGSQVLFTRSELDWKENEYADKQFLVPASGGTPYQFIGEEGGSSFEFSPDGEFLAFKRKVKEGEKELQQIFFMRTDGGEAIQLTEHKTSVDDFVWTPGSADIVFTADEARSEEEEEEFKAGYDAIYVDEGPNGQTRGHWKNLWSIGLDEREEERLTDDDMIVEDFDVSPDGQKILFTARFENRRNQQNLSEIFLLDLTSGERRQLTENRAPEQSPRWAPNGESLAFVAPDIEEWELRQSKIWIMAVETGTARLAVPDFPGSVQDFQWGADHNSVLVSAEVRTDANLFKFDLQARTWEPVTELKGRVGRADFSANRRVTAFSFEDWGTPPDLFLLDLESGEQTQLTHLNSWFSEEIQTAKPRLIQWESQDGLEIEGILTMPLEAETGENLPLLLHVHGGPAGVFSNRFTPSYHIWAGLGYVSLAPNVRGSDAYGDAFLRGNIRDIGGGDYQDLMTGVDYVIEQGWVDPGKMGIRGWSYGGILGGWTITQTDRFKAASLGAMVSDWTSEYGPGFNYDVRLWYIGGTPWENPEDYREKSALAHVGQVETPTLLLHGIEDRTDTEPQSMMFFTALKDRGVPTRYIKFPRERHGFTEPRHMRTRDIEEISWMQKYVLGKEWEPWERAEEEESEEKPDSGK